MTNLKRKYDSIESSSDSDEVIIKKRRLDANLEETIQYYANLIPNSDSWKTARLEFELTASEIAAAIGVSKYKSPNKLWEEKKGIREVENLDDNPIVQWGVQNEPEARWEFETSFMLEDMPDYSISQPGLTVYREDPRYAASLDNLVFDPEDPDNPDKRIVVEYKCPQQHYASVPLEYMIQIQVQMEFANANSGYFYAWRPDSSNYTIIKRNKKFFDKFIYPKMKQFSKMLKRDEYSPKRMPNGLRDQLREEVMNYFPEIYTGRKK